METVNKEVRRRHRRSTAERIAELEAMLEKRQEQEKMLADRIRALKFGRKAMTVAQLAKAMPQVKKVFSGHQITMETVLGMALVAMDSVKKGENSVESLSEMGQKAWRTTRATQSAAVRKEEALSKQKSTKAATKKPSTRIRKTA